MTLGGELHVTWLRKFSTFQEDNPVDISWLKAGLSSPGGSNNGTARLSTIPGLSLGAAYTVTIMDLASEDALLTFSFTACKLVTFSL